MSEDSLPRVVIVGRPNVGKSSLFNRILGERRAIIEDEPGTTRDRIEAEVEWRDVPFLLVDTGGFETDDENVFAALVMGQVREAIAGAQVVLFCVDARDGLTASDHDMADVIRKAGKAVIVVGTKADNEAREWQSLADAARFGFGEPIPVSALHNINVGAVLDEVIANLSAPSPSPEVDRIRVAVIGRPNVGKSMLVNALLGKERVIVSEVPGTTRDAIDIELSTPEGEFTLVDTAGVRRPGRLGRATVERHSVLRTKAAVERCDVAVLVVDGTEGVTAQDTHIASVPIEAAKGLIIAINKVDLWEDPVERRSWAERQLRSRVQFVPWAMLTFISAKEGTGLEGLLELARQVREVRRRRVQTAELNTVVRRAMAAHVPPQVKGKRLKFLFATQASIDPPTFVLFVNDPAIVHFSFRRYVERAIREAYDFEGTAIRLVFRARADDDGRS